MSRPSAPSGTPANTVSTPQLDHAAEALSTAPNQASDEANYVRHRAGARGHVESHFLKANSPDGRRAIWLKHTLLVPTAASRPSLAELWAIAFDDRGRKKLALKQSFPLSAAHFERAPFRFVLPDAELRTNGAVGRVGPRASQIAWQLRFDASGPPFLPFRFARMYTGGFPRSKSLTPLPDTRVHGEVEVLGERWQLDGWRGAMGHNWGRSHAHAYAWLHTNVLSHEPGGPPLSDTWVETLTGRIRIAGLLTPWLSMGAIAVAGRVHRFDGLSALLSREVSIAPDAYQLRLEQDGAQLELSLCAPAERFAGLRYQDPDESSLTCLNSKLALGTFRLTHQGRTWQLHSEQAALEVGTREPHSLTEVLV